MARKHPFLVLLLFLPVFAVAQSAQPAPQPQADCGSAFDYQVLPGRPSEARTTRCRSATGRSRAPWYPPFHYNPKLFWDADPKDSKETIPAGPNNPIGVVWNALNLRHYGIHGTPAPALVGHSYSHGCVRLTNWNAARVARAVRQGTVVHFR